MIQSVLNQLIIKLTPLLPRSIVWRIAGKYVAGETAEEALSVIKELNDKKFSATVDILGEHTLERNEAISIRDDYIYLLEQLWKHKMDCNISLKASHLGSTACVTMFGSGPFKLQSARTQRVSWAPAKMPAEATPKAGASGKRDWSNFVML